MEKVNDKYKRIRDSIIDGYSNRRSDDETTKLLQAALKKGDSELVEILITLHNNYKSDISELKSTNRDLLLKLIDTNLMLTEDIEKNRKSIENVETSIGGIIGGISKAHGSFTNLQKTMITGVVCIAFLALLASWAPNAVKISGDVIRSVFGNVLTTQGMQAQDPAKVNNWMQGNSAPAPQPASGSEDGD